MLPPLVIDQVRYLYYRKHDKQYNKAKNVMKISFDPITKMHDRVIPRTHRNRLRNSPTLRVEITQYLSLQITRRDRTRFIISFNFYELNRLLLLVFRMIFFKSILPQNRQLIITIFRRKHRKHFSVWQTC